ncbi:MAG TPA: hypothetical protein VFK21_01745 [Gammaproteobacteria bacterium]|nr:hypothetical protein [Gammaproteobacteria bacterium]
MPAAADAHVTIGYPADWNLGGPANKGVAMGILKLDDTDVCKSGDDCPIELDVPAGTHTLLFHCMVLQDNLHTPALAPWVRVSYQGDFIAGHRYQVRPASSVPDCKIQVEDKGPAG